MNTTVNADPKAIAARKNGGKIKTQRTNPAKLLEQQRANQWRKEHILFEAIRTTK